MNDREMTSPPNLRGVKHCGECKHQGYDSGNIYCEKHQIIVGGCTVCDDFIEKFPTKKN